MQWAHSKYISFFKLMLFQEEGRGGVVPELFFNIKRIWEGMNPRLGQNQCQLLDIDFPNPRLLNTGKKLIHNFLSSILF